MAKLLSKNSTGSSGSTGGTVYFWFRRDLRLDDNAALYYALKHSAAENLHVRPLFIFDTNILERLEDRDDARVTFIYDTLVQLQEQLRKLGSDLLVLHGDPIEIWPQLLSKQKVAAVYANHDYEPSAIARDDKIKTSLARHHVEFKTYKDQCIFEKNEVVKDDTKPYTVFTPYKNKWLSLVSDFYLKAYPVEKWSKSFDQKLKAEPIITLKALGFARSKIPMPPPTIKKSIIKTYDQFRDLPAKNATSHLGLHLRFGTVSIRTCARLAQANNDVWLSELIWRDFFMQILWHFPHVVNGAFRPAYDKIKWLNDKKQFAAWCEGRTGYSLVDAGMRQLNESGTMHNRVRMLTASFLVKDLLIDWRWGERYFARRLLDYDLSANNGNWQWAAGTGCDAAPYFRVFSPEAQQEKFDRNYDYVKTWAPDYKDVAPIVDHKMARVRAIEAFKKALKS